MAKPDFKRIWIVFFPFSKTSFAVFPHTMMSSTYCRCLGASTCSSVIWISPWQMIGLCFYPGVSWFQVYQVYPPRKRKLCPALCWQREWEKMCWQYHLWHTTWLPDWEHNWENLLKALSSLKSIMCYGNSGSHSHLIILVVLHKPISRI